MEEEGVYDVSMESNVICPQLANGVPIGQEDCLFLNIYVPEKVLNHVEKVSTFWCQLCFGYMVDHF